MMDIWFWLNVEMHTMKVFDILFLLQESYFV